MSKKTTSNDVCQIRCFNRPMVNKIKKTIPNLEKINNLVETLKAVSDGTRMKILFSLNNGELCVCDIAHVLNMSLSAVSHQLRILRNLRLIKYRNDGRMVYYSILDKNIVKLIEKYIKLI